MIFYIYNINMSDINTPIYKVMKPSDDNEGVFMLSLVDEPAIESNWILQSKGIEPIIMKAEKSKQMLYGAALIPNKVIPRLSEDGEKFNLIWDAQTIENIAYKFNRENLAKNINFQHSDRMVDGYVAESWIVNNPSIDKSKSLGLNLAKGSWVVGVKINDKQFWNDEIAMGKLKGFSVEALIQKMEFKKIKIEQKSMISKLKERLLSMFDTIEQEEVKQATTDYTTLDGQTISSDGKTVVLGDVTLPYAKYYLEDGTTLVFNSDGVTIEAIEEEMAATTLTLKNGDTLNIDDKGMVTDSTGTPVKDGDYETNDSQIVTIVGGMITDKKPLAMEGDSTEMAKIENKNMEATNEKFSKYDEILETLTKSVEALNSKIDNFGKTPATEVNLSLGDKINKVQSIGQKTVKVADPNEDALLYFQNKINKN